MIAAISARTRTEQVTLARSKARDHGVSVVAVNDRQPAPTSPADKGRN